MTSCSQAKVDSDKSTVDLENLIEQIETKDCDSVIASVQPKDDQFGIDSIQLIYLKALCFDKTGNIQKSLYLLDKMQSISMSSNISRSVLKLRGLLYFRSGDYTQALNTFRKLANIYADSNNLELKKAYSNISSSFFYLENYDSSLFYQERAIEILKNNSNNQELNSAKIELLSVLVQLERIHEADSLVLEIDDNDLSSDDLSSYLLCLSSIKYIKANYQEAKDLNRRILNNSVYKKDSNEIALALENISTLYWYLSQPDSAFIYLDSAVRINQQIQRSEFANSVKELELKYQDLQRDRELDQLQAQARFDKAFRIGLISVSSLLGLLALSIYLYYRSYVRNQRQLQAAERTRIMQQSEIKSMHATLRAVEEERKRMAMDLHDGIGAIAGAVKLKLSRLHEADKKVTDQMLAEADQDLDEISNHAREIAHNILPPALSKFGLKVATEELCDQFQDETGVEANTEISELHIDQDPFYSVTLYRLIQELLNNAKKHSACTEIKVTLEHTAKGFSLTYQDNGRGFDEYAFKKEGIGLNIMRSRIENLGGKMKIISEIETGARIEFFIPDAQMHKTASQQN